MKNLEYKGYTGSIEYSKEDDLLFGKVLGVRGLISYEGKTGNELENDFKEAIVTYLSDCNEKEIAPEKPFKGSFNVRVSAELHQKAALLAKEEKMSLNSFVAESIRERIFKESRVKIIPKQQNQ
jgi:predicted HicB family RNase H-like nuclease